MDKEAFFLKRIQEATSTKEKLFISAVYLFAKKGYANVGIREICSSLNIKGSAFYNHYRSKKDLFKEILDCFSAMMNKMTFSDEEIDEMATRGDIRYFLEENMRKFSQITNNTLFYTILQIILMESYTNEQAYALGKNNLYYWRRGYTEKVLAKMIENGSIKEFDVKMITAEYYYALKGLLDEYLLHEVWNEDKSAIMEKITQHIDFFVNILKK